MKAHLIALALVLPAAGSAAAAPVSFSHDVVPILRQRCVMCHLSGSEPGGLSLVPKAAYANLVGAASQEAPLKRVEPGKPDDSYLIHKLEGTQKDVGGKGARMPFSGPPLDKDQMALLRQWIEEGAPDN